MNPWEDSSIEKPIAGLDKSQYGGFSTDEYTFDYENDESYPETLREKLYDKGLGKLYIMRNIPFWSDALEATPYHANINAGAAAFIEWKEAINMNRTSTICIMVNTRI